MDSSFSDDVDFDFSFPSGLGTVVIVNKSYIQPWIFHEAIRSHFSFAELNPYELAEIPDEDLFSSLGPVSDHILSQGPVSPLVTEIHPFFIALH